MKLKYWYKSCVHVYKTHANFQKKLSCSVVCEITVSYYDNAEYVSNRNCKKHGSEKTMRSSRTSTIMSLH